MRAHQATLMAAVLLGACSGASDRADAGQIDGARLPDGGGGDGDVVDDGSTLLDAPACADVDGDGHGASPCGDDCDDSNPDINPSVSETCNSVDDDCSGTVDDGAASTACAPGTDPHVVGVCSAGACTTGCDPSYLDCSDAAGCETARDDSHCGGCDRSCFHPSCSAGVCLDDYVELALGDGFSCGRRGSGIVECWGDNRVGQLGDGTMISHSAPAPVLGLADAIEIAAGDMHACAIRSDRSLVCWGYNNQGQLGNGGSDDASLPTIAASDARGLVAGSHSTCFRTASGQVMCAGYLAGGATFTAVAGIDDAVQVAAGSQHFCARRASGPTVCWGVNSDGQLGDGTTTDRTAPTAVIGMDNARAISAGYAHTCARNTDNEIWCWGSNDSGQLGDGTQTSSSTPVQAMTTIGNPTTLALQAYAGCARGATGVVACWGSGGGGALGDGSGNDFSTGVRVAGLSDAVSVQSGFNLACARRTNGQVVCWGNNPLGQLGDGTMASRFTPTAILDP